MSRGAICLAYIHSQMNMHMCTKFSANRCSRLTASPDFWICDPITPPPPPKYPRGIEGRIVFSLCPFPDESADMYQLWCQSVQSLDSLPRLFNLWPYPPPPQFPPWYWGDTCFSLCPSQDESIDVNQSWCQFDSFPDFWICDPLTPPPPEIPLGYWGANCN